MNVLVTGAAGFIGNHLCRYLQKEHYVVGVYHDRFPSTATFHAVQADVTNTDRLLSLLVNLEIDFVYHCAARSIVRHCCQDPLDCFSVNIMGTAALLEACRRSEQIKGVMCMESDKSYGPGPLPYKEDQALNPTGIYEASKACAGHIARCYYKNFGVPVFTVRSANVYGPSDPNKSRLIPNTIKRLRAGHQPEITTGADRFSREFIYIKDFIAVVVGLMEAIPWGKTINVGSGEMATVTEIIQLICSTMKRECSPVSLPGPKTLQEIEHQQLDTTLMHSLLPSLRSFFTLPEGIKATCST